MLALAQEIGFDQPRPDQIVGAQELKGARHLAAVEITLGAHDVVEERQLILGDEELQLARLGEIRLRA